MSRLYNLSFVSALYNLLLSTEQATFFITSYLLVFTVQSIFCECTVQPTFYYPPNKLPFFQGWVIRRRRIIRRIVFITYLTVFFKLLRIIRFWALNEFCSHKPPRAPQKHSQALKSPTEALPSPLEPPRGTPSPSERSMITCLLLPQPRR